MALIRKLTTDDFEDLVILLSEYKKSIRETQLTEQQLISLRCAIENGRIVFYVVAEDDELVAMCSITTAFSTYKCSSMGIFEDFYIKPSYRGKGIASELTRYVFVELKRMGILSVWVGCVDLDVEMYKHLGFNAQLGNLLAWSNE